MRYPDHWSIKRLILSHFRTATLVELGHTEPSEERDRGDTGAVWAIMSW